MQKELDLTQGSVPRVLLQFAMPYLLANVLQALYGGADLFVVGQFDDAASVAGVAIGSQVMQTVTGIILGLTTGITVLIGIATGARNYRELASIIGSSVWLFGIVGVGLTLLMTVLHNPIAVLMHTPVEALRDTEHYLLICSLGIPFIIGYNVVCGILRGLGDSRTPLYFVALACVINVGLDFLLVGGFHLRAMGAAIATVASQGISFLTALWYLHRRGFRFEFTRRDIRLDGRLSKRVLTLGAPIALQDALINISFLIITVMAIPCVLGFNYLSFVHPLGFGTILDFQDFLISNNVLPIGSLVFVLFITAKTGWGFDNYLKECNIGDGVKLSRGLIWYFRFVMPLIIAILLVAGYVNIFG